MIEDKKKQAGADITKGLKNMSEKDWAEAMKKAEQSEERRASWMAELMKEEQDKKKDEGHSGPVKDWDGPQ